MAEVSVEQFEKLQNRLKKIEPRIAELEGIRKTKKAQTREIYEKWGVNKLSELKELKEEKEKAAKEVYESLKEYVEEMDSEFDKLDEDLV
jgi:hypothetical protein